MQLIFDNNNNIHDTTDNSHLLFINIIYFKIVNMNNGKLFDKIHLPPPLTPWLVIWQSSMRATPAAAKTLHWSGSLEQFP